MMRTAEAIAKSVLVMVLVGATLVASFYFAYIFVGVLILGGVGVVSYLYFHQEEKEPNWFDFRN